MSYHQPVMLSECIEAMTIKEGGIYIDLTFGGGGHSKAILDRIGTGKLYGFDQDKDAKINAAGLIGHKFEFIQANFRYFKKYLRMYGITQVDGILADLGISSHQIDSPERGFSTRFDAELDMRMDRSASISAKNVVNDFPERQLMMLLSKYGDLKNAPKLARAIVSARVMKPIVTIAELKEVLGKFAPRGKENQFFAKVFQAIRIEVNKEMEVLEEMLLQGADLLKPEGRFVIMSYHSLEDRLVKNFFNKGNFTGEAEKDFYGNLIRPMEPINRKPLLADETELALNKRARSAKLRIAKKIENG